MIIARYTTFSHTYQRHTFNDGSPDSVSLFVQGHPIPSHLRSDAEKETAAALADLTLPEPPAQGMQVITITADQIIAQIETNRIKNESEK